VIAVSYLAYYNCVLQDEINLRLIASSILGGQHAALLNAFAELRGGGDGDKPSDLREKCSRQQIFRAQDGLLVLQTPL
jgi:hypothetical protein